VLGGESCEKGSGDDGIEMVSRGVEVGGVCVGDGRVKSIGGIAGGVGRGMSS
jgi:hypothetical protein